MREHIEIELEEGERHPSDRPELKRLEHLLAQQSMQIARLIQAVGHLAHVIEHPQIYHPLVGLTIT